MKELVREAIQISKELNEVVFIGAIAVYLHTKTTRESHDIDFAIASKISREELLEKGYNIYQERGKEIIRTPRYTKVDIYTDDVSGIPVNEIIKTAVDIEVNKKGEIIKIASLEALIVAKHRASRPSRPQDTEDLRDIALRKYNIINWELLKTFIKDEYEFENIKTTMLAQHKYNK